VLDKSPKWVLDNNWIQIQKEFEDNLPSIVLCSETFHKIEFLNKLINSFEEHIIFVDMDLLYTGYIESGMIQQKDNVTIFNPNKVDWAEKVATICTKISKTKIVVIIDSFNGIYNMFNDLESSIFINSCIMLFSSLGRQTRSSVVITAMARKKDDEWILSPGGRHIIRSEKTGIYFLKKIKNNLVLTSVNDTDSKGIKIKK
jgi:hypothetical protein